MIARRAGIIRNHARVGGFTLLELLLVLGILVLLAAVAWPRFSGPLATTRLREGARGMCNEVARARLRAIETGNVLVLSYEPGSGRYAINTRTAVLGGGDAAPSDEDMLETVSAQDGPSRTWPAGGFVPFEGELPAGVRFAGANSPVNEQTVAGETFGSDTVADTDAADAAPETSLAETDDLAFDSTAGGLAADIGRGTGVYLYPDGTARDTTIRLVNQRGASIEIKLRGMTGGTRLGSVIEPQVMP